ncbi:hypothetical protein ADIARSV_0531 [Arcticibacter svalbardensis MN12-7]|uniref:DUF4843 domain-containing protein n=1 Tax=Arcticibacter svalbardensis MN12-7 TaxID=1150600 RepID=R9GX12_9SPHI|nr:DUF4843 domain-containing protein [Arcticibacter svalbardensis]EOR96296.1 hypothetical protein ADIARSV_0531 [Arcticibacter svalbardensis MN12-7]
MKKIKFFLTTLVLITVIFGGCQKDTIQEFKALSAVNFTQVSNLYSITYSFLTNPSGEYIQIIPVSILGDSTDYDRSFNVEVVNDSVTTAPPELYGIIGGTVKAGQFNGTLSVKLLNSELLNDSIVTLKLKIVDSKDFNKGNLESREFIVSWTNRIIVPTWNVYLRTFITPKRSTLAFRLFLQISGLTQFGATEYRNLGAAGVEALGTKYGDYIMQWNQDHPDNILRHDDGPNAGEPIVAIYYTHSKFD